DDVLTLAVLGVLAREDGRPRGDRLELLARLLDQGGGQHAVVLGRLVRVLEGEIPSAEHDVLELRELEVIGDLLAGRRVADLGQHAVAGREVARHEARARDEGGRNGAVDADDGYTELVLHRTSSLWLWEMSN